MNEEKTNLMNAITYAMNPDKNEQRIFEGSSYCDKEQAFEQMMETKKKLKNEGGVQGYHIIQSFAPNEVTPEQAFKIAEEFVHRYLSKKYETVWSTHLDKNHYHNHIVFNSVSYIDGKKYESNYKSYYNGIRKTSDDICKEHNLSVIVPNVNNKSLTYIEWLALHKGKSTWQSLIRNDIDQAISKSFSYGAFLVYMENVGYEIKDGKHLAFKPFGKERFARGYKLGKGYSEDEIRRKIDGQEIPDVPSGTAFYQPSRRKKKWTKTIIPDYLKVYWRWMYMMGLVKKYKAPPRMSKYLKEELLKFEKYKEQFSFLKTHDIKTESELNEYINACKTTIAKLNNKLYKIQHLKKKKIYKALSNKEKYKKAYQLYIAGYHQMKPEYEIYQSAIKILNDNGYIDDVDIQALEKEKAELYTQIADIKHDLYYFKKEIKICVNINESMKIITEKMSKVELLENEKSKQKEKESDINGRT